MTTAEPRLSFLEELKLQRWDDHRYYHQSRVNQSLHLVSACSFLSSYVLMFISPPAAVFIGWLVAMVTRQSGHFFFEPKSYDAVNQVTHEHKEKIKVGYNLERKIYLLSIWVAMPFALWASPTFFGLLDARQGWYGFAWNLSLLWLFLGGLAILARTVWLGFTRGWQTGAVWAAKILTDPFHDVKIYHRSPLHLLRGERLDPMTGWPEPFPGYTARAEKAAATA